jgi:endonuclease/exonuclease/phosphatase family metal-dependent hydrolase
MSVGRSRRSVRSFGSLRSVESLIVRALALLLVLGASSRASAAELRVVTFNVAMGAAFRKPFTGLIRGTFEENPHLTRFDVIGLQEACLNERGPIDVFRGVMQRAHGRVYEHVFRADSNSRESCQKAQVILSRYPMRARGGFLLPFVGARRSAAWADLDVAGETLRVYDVHLSNRSSGNYKPLRGREAQARVVLAHWLAARAKNPKARGIILGDFNSLGNIWEPHKPEPAISLISRHLTPSLLKFRPTMWVPYKTDWIFSSGLRLKKSHVVPTAYSDHFVVVADYEI